MWCKMKDVFITFWVHLHWPLPLTDSSRHLSSDLPALTRLLPALTLHHQLDTSHIQSFMSEPPAHVDVLGVMEFLQLWSGCPSLSPFLSDAVLSREVLSSKASFWWRSQCLEPALRGSPSEESDVTSPSAADTFSGFSQMNYFIKEASFDNSSAVFTDWLLIDVCRSWSTKLLYLTILISFKSLKVMAPHSLHAKPFQSVFLYKPSEICVKLQSHYSSNYVYKCAMWKKKNQKLTISKGGVLLIIAFFDLLIAIWLWIIRLRLIIPRHIIARREVGFDLGQ